jgi:hypothetical protein
MPGLKRRCAAPAAGIIAALLLCGALLLAAAAHRVAGELIFAPRFASSDASEVVRAYFTARQWGYRGLSKRALAPEVWERLHAANVVHPLIDDPFLARDLAVSAPQETPLYGEYDKELLFVVTYRSRWREVTGAPPGPRGWFVYAGRNAGGPWQILGQGTGP